MEKREKIEEEELIFRSMTHINEDKFPSTEEPSSVPLKYEMIANEGAQQYQIIDESEINEVSYTEDRQKSYSQQNRSLLIINPDKEDVENTSSEAAAYSEGEGELTTKKIQSINAILD